MRCPVCTNSTLVTEPLEDQMLTMRCPDCQGHWVKSFQYWRWREQQPESQTPVLPEAASIDDANDSGPGKLCPECGRFLSHRPVGHGVEFSLDRCSHCGGMWFDKAEWDALKTRALHQNTHYVFTDAWQADVRESHRVEMERNRLKNKLGEQAFDELIRVGRWLHDHPQRASLLAVLCDKDIEALIAEE